MGQKRLAKKSDKKYWTKKWTTNRTSDFENWTLDIRHQILDIRDQKSAILDI